MKHLIFILSTLVFSNCTNEMARVYLVPKGYEGPLVLIEDPESKHTLSINKDTMIFDFSNSTILRINGVFIEGSTSLKKILYYYVDENGNREKIPFSFGNNTKQDSSLVYVHMMHTQIRKGSQCDVISSPKYFRKCINEQFALCDSLFSRRNNF